MINWLSRTIWLVLVMALAVAGCEQEQRQEQERKQTVDVSGYKPPFISRAVEATGELDAWTKTQKLEFDCVVAFYRPDGSYYLTKQHHEIHPWSSLIRVSAQEPQGNFIWEFSPDGMKVIEGTKQADFLPIGLGAEDYVKAILDITTTPVRLLENKAEYVRSPNPVKIEGQWYYPIGRVKPGEPDSEPVQPKLAFYQKRNSSLVDMLWFEGADRGSAFLVRGYNYHEVQKGGVYVPAKIEFFMADVRGVMQNRLVKIDYHQIKAIK